MKKILCTLAIAGLAASAVAQGTIAFGPNNASSTIMFKQTQDATAVAVPNAAAFVQLVWAPQGSSFTAWNGQSLTAWLNANPAWQLAGTAKPTGPAPGRIQGTEVQVPTATPGAVIDAAMIGWAAGHSGFDAALLAGAPIGFSDKFVVDTGNPNAQPVAEPAGLITGTGGFAGMTIAPIIPEPSSMALVGLGAAALLALRRRK